MEINKYINDSNEKILKIILFFFRNDKLYTFLIFTVLENLSFGF